MREIRGHHTTMGPSALQIETTDPVDPSGAPRRYRITGLSMANHPSAMFADPVNQIVILFQSGDPAVVGCNGVTMEALLAIVADHLEAFQNGAFPCEENAEALDHTRAALIALHRRTLKRDPSAVLLKAESVDQPTTDVPYQNAAPGVSREMIFQAMEQSGFQRTQACCGDVPLKLCANDQYKGNLGGFVGTLMRLLKK